MRQCAESDTSSERDSADDGTSPGAVPCVYVLGARRAAGSTVYINDDGWSHTVAEAHACLTIPDLLGYLQKKARAGAHIDMGLQVVRVDREERAPQHVAVDNVLDGTASDKFIAVLAHINAEDVVPEGYEQFFTIQSAIAEAVRCSRGGGRMYKVLRVVSVKAGPPRLVPTVLR